MKKSLIALAALAATSAFAQSSVTLYGIVEAGVDLGYNRTVDTVTTTRGFTAAGAAATSPSLTAPTYVNNVLTFGAAVNTGNVVNRTEQKNGMRVQDGNDQGSGTSRVGFRGTEDLGGGMNANFQLEMGLRLDDGAITGGQAAVPSSGNSGGNAFGRNAWGGISGGFGEFRIGRQVLGSFGVQANSWSAGSSNGLYDAGATTAPLMGGVRFSNAIRYMSPTFGGFKGSLMLAAPETEGDTSTSTVTTTTPPAVAGTVLTTTTSASRRTGVDLALEYANGPAYIGFGYNVRDGANNNTGGVTGFAVGQTNSNTANPEKISAWTLGGSYDLGVVKPFINYTRQTTKNDRTDTLATGAAATSSSIATNGDSNVRAWSIGLRAPVGAFTIIAGYGNAKTSGLQTSAVNQNGVVNLYSTNNQRKQTAYQLGASYALSKRTSLQVNYGQNKLENNTDAVVTNNNNAAFGANSIRANTKVSAINFGMKHSF
jgi:predicted porin